MSVEYIDDHPFTGQVLEINNTEENRLKYRWYFKNNFHHYRFICKSIYTNGNDGGSAYTFVHSRIDGMTEDSEMEWHHRHKERMNLPAELMKISGSTNKTLKYLLSTVEDWKEKQQSITIKIY